MIIATFNVNSVRKRLPHVLAWLSAHQPDVLCLQETKVSDAAFPVAAIRDLGYHVETNGLAGYAGVATLSRQKPDSVIRGLEKKSAYEDPRLLLTVFAGLPVINTYVPQGTDIATARFTFKLEWFKRLRGFLDRHLDPAKPALWIGDMNVAPEPIDVYHPDRRLTDPCFDPRARKAYKETLAWGFVDVFREKYPDRVQYTYWDYWRGMLEHNYGWRLDHILATQGLAARCKRIEVDMAPRKAKEPSDHTVIWAEFSVPAAKRK